MLWKPPFIFFLPVIEMLVIGYITGNFFSLNNILNIIYRFSMLGLVVIGMSFVILSGGIDFSGPLYILRFDTRINKCICNIDQHIYNTDNY
jgi:ribose/xylose/arabinose/galactoside ABC-type transport system permease subunit